MRFQPSLSGTFSLSRTDAFFLGGGKALVNAYCRTAGDLGIEISYEREVTHLEHDRTRISKVETSVAGERVTLSSQSDQVAYAAIDSKSLELFMPPMFPPIQADTVEGLRQQLGLPGDALRATVDRFNPACRAGRFIRPSSIGWRRTALIHRRPIGRDRSPSRRFMDMRCGLG